MSTVNTAQAADKKLNTHKLISTIIIVIGVVLMVYMILVEDEPGGIPLLLIAGGTVWHLITRARIRSHHKQLRQ